MKDVPPRHQLFVLMDANARTGRRDDPGDGSEYSSTILGAYGRDSRNDNGERLLHFADDHHLAIVNTFFSTLKEAYHTPSTETAGNGSTTSPQGTPIANL